jgi:NTE family protein
MTPQSTPDEHTVKTALAAQTVAEPLRRAAVAARLPATDWPQRQVLIVAVDAGTGDLAVFDRASGVGLVDAVTASCAVPGVWPPVSINGRRYIDGGARSITNADLAAGCDRVLVITPTLPGAPSLTGSLNEEIEGLAPAQVFVVYADQDSIEAFGRNPLSPATRGPAARAGRTRGRDLADTVAAFWG